MKQNKGQHNTIKHDTLQRHDVSEYYILHCPKDVVTYTCVYSIYIHMCVRVKGVYAYMCMCINGHIETRTCCTCTRLSTVPSLTG